MFIIDENEKEYRFGDSGPKYLMKGPRSNFALVQFQAGQDFKAHYHNIIEVDGVCHTLKAGQLIHIEPKEVHYVINRSNGPVKMVSTLAPYQEVDKVEVN